MAPRFFQPRRQNLVTARYRPAIPDTVDLGPALSRFASDLNQYARNERRRADDELMSRLRPEMTEQLTRLQIENRDDPDAFMAAAETALETSIEQAGFYDAAGARREMYARLSGMQSNLIRQSAERARNEQIKLAEQRREGLIEDAVIASRNGDSELVGDLMERHRGILAQGVDEGWFDQADAAEAEQQIVGAIEQERSVGAIMEAYQGGGLTGAKAAAERIRTDPNLELSPQQRERAASQGLARARAEDRDRRVAAAEARRAQAMQSKMAVDDIQLALKEFEALGTGDPWEVFEDVRGALDPVEENQWEQRLALSSRIREAEQEATDEAELNAYRESVRQSERNQLMRLYAAGVYDEADIGDHIAEGRIRPDERDAFLEAYGLSPQAEARAAENAAAAEAMEEQRQKQRTALKVQEQLARGATYTDAANNDLEALDAYAEVAGLQAGASDPAQVARIGAIPPSMAAQLRLGTNDPDMMRWGAEVVAQVRRQHGGAAAGAVLNQVGGVAAELIPEIERGLQTMAPGSEEAQRMHERAVERIGDRPRTEGLQELISQETTFIDQQLQQRFLSKVNGWKEFGRRHGFLSGVDEVDIPPGFRDAFEFNLEGVLRESRHPSNKPITDEQLDRAMAETTRVWGPARQSDGSTAIVPHPVDKVADRLAPARGMSPDWVYEQVFEANRDALTSRDSVTYVDDDYSFSEFRRDIEEGRVELRATDTTVLADGGTPPMEVWVRTNDGRKVPIGGFGEAVEFKPSWRGLGRSDHVDGIDAPLEGTNDRAIERWQRAREWTEWAAPIVPGLDQQDTALVHNLMAREFGLEDLGAWARKDMTILRALASLPSATLAAAGLSAKALKRGAGFEDEREIGETE